MNEISLVLLALVAFIAGFIGRNVAVFVLNKLGLKKSPSQPVNKVQEVSSQNVSHSDEEFHVLGKMGYYLASNDESNMPAFSASPMQDTDPKDLA